MRALVSGGSNGIGAAASLRLAEAALARGEQAMIAVCGHTSNARQEEVVHSIQSIGGKAIALVGDLGDPEVPQQLVAAAVDEFGGLDALVANAGIANPARSRIFPSRTGTACSPSTSAARGFSPKQAIRT